MRRSAREGITPTSMEGPGLNAKRRSQAAISRSRLISVKAKVSAIRAPVARAASVVKRCQCGLKETAMSWMRRLLCQAKALVRRTTAVDQKPTPHGSNPILRPQRGPVAAAPALAANHATQAAATRRTVREGFASSAMDGRRSQPHLVCIPTAHGPAPTSRTPSDSGNSAREAARVVALPSAQSSSTPSRPRYQSDQEAVIGGSHLSGITSVSPPPISGPLGAVSATAGATVCNVLLAGDSGLRPTCQLRRCGVLATPARYELGRGHNAGRCAAVDGVGSRTVGWHTSYQCASPRAW